MQSTQLEALLETVPEVVKDMLAPLKIEAKDGDLEVYAANETEFDLIAHYWWWFYRLGEFDFEGLTIYRNGELWLRWDTDQVSPASDILMGVYREKWNEQWAKDLL